VAAVALILENILHFAGVAHVGGIAAAGAAVEVFFVVIITAGGERKKRQGEQRDTEAWDQIVPVCAWWVCG
jgi:hypothetical protein